MIVDEAFFAVLAFFFLSIFPYDWFRTEPIVHPENFRYLPFLASSGHGGVGGELAKIFDVCSLDFCLGRFRPLGHLLELVDAKVIRELNPEYPYRFRSLTHLCFGIAVAATLTAALKRARPKESWQFLAMIGSFAAVMPQLLVLNTCYFRPGKTFSAWVASFMVYSWIRYSDENLGEVWRRTPERLRLVAAAGIAALGTLGDEQAAFFVVQFAGLALCEVLFRKRGTAFLAVAGFAGIFYAISVKWIGPWTFARYSTSVVVQDWADPRSYLHADYILAWTSLDALRYEFMMLWGNAPEFSPTVNAAVLGGIALLIVSAFRRLPEEKAFKGHRYYEMLRGYFFLSLLALYYLMGARHSFVVDAGVPSGGYYSLPSSVLMYALLALGFLVSGAFEGLRRKRIVAGGLAVFAMMSVASLSGLRQRLFGDGGWVESREVARVLDRESSNDSDGAGVSADARSFVSYWRREILAKSRHPAGRRGP